MAAIYETTPITPSPVYLDTHSIDPWWGTVLPNFLRTVSNSPAGNQAIQSVYTTDQGIAKTVSQLDPVKAIEDYLNQNLINYAVGGVGLLLVSAAVFQVVKPL